MIYGINEDQRNELLDQAEYGMGYQLAQDGAYVFLNAEIAIGVHDSELAMTKEDVEWLRDFLLQHNADQGAMLAKLPEYNRNLEVTAHGSYPSHTVPGERFWRYSAFPRDRRIRRNQSVLPGTYATTENDSKLVSSGLGAVGRYALPNYMPARYVHVLQPPATQPIPISCGNSAPKFGQAGGGVEILFTQGLPQSSAQRAQSIAER